MTHLLAPYTSLEELDARAERLAVAAGAERVVFGESVEGRPRVLVCANVHGVEFIAAEVALGVLGALTWPAHPVRRAAEVWVVPTLNPDAYAATWRGKGRGSVKACRTNARGVDLNRNFPLPGKQPLWSRPFAGWATGSEDPGHTCYRGPKPLSEPETQAMDRLMQRGFVASANLHSSWGTLFPAHVDDAVSFHHYRKLCQAFRQAQGHRRYMALSSRRLDWFTGEMEDHQHHVYGCWRVCVETFHWRDRTAQLERHSDVFWRYNPRDPTECVENDVPGVLAFLKAACASRP